MYVCMYMYVCIHIYIYIYKHLYEGSLQTIADFYFNVEINKYSMFWEFRDVVFEDVGFETNSLLTLKKVWGLHT